MAATARKKQPRRRESAKRRQLRRQGLKPIQIWVPDVTSKTFAAEAHRQSRAVAASPYADEDQAFIDAISESPHS